MNARLRKALEDRAAAWSAYQDIDARRSAAGYDPSTEDGEAATRSLDEVERLSRIIEEEQRAERLGTSLNTPGADQRGTNPIGDEHGQEGPDVSAQYRGDFGTYLVRGLGGLNVEQRERLEQGFVETNDNEKRALGASVDAAGGFTVPKEFLQRMTEAQKAFGGIFALADVLPTATGRELSWPTNDETAAEGHILDENTEDTELDTVFGSTALRAYMYTSRIVRLSRQLLQDTAFPLETWLPTKLGERIARATARHFAVGTGTAQPQGIVTGLTKTVTTSASGKIAFEDLIDLEHSLDAAYRNSGNLRYVLADGVVRDLRKLKDAQGRPLWLPAFTAGAPETINGRPYSVENSFPTLAAGSKSVVFGDIKAAYLVRQVAGAQTLRLDERYATSLQVGFLGFQRWDGKVQDTGAAAALITKA